MNIHYTYDEAEKCAKVLDDKRVNKMLLETAQMLSTTLHELDLVEPNIYKPFNANHPVNKWVREAFQNYIWTLDYFKALCLEYSYRHKDSRRHKSQELLTIFDKYKYRVRDKLPNYKTPHINCARSKANNLDFSDMEDTKLAYRQYLKERWRNDKRTPTWTNRPVPEWLDQRSLT